MMRPSTRTRIGAATLLAVTCAGPSAWAAAPVSVFVPSTLTFQAEFRGITAGTIAISLREEAPGKFVYASRAHASGLAKLIVRHEILEASTFELAGDEIRPLSYILDDGSPDTAKDTRLEFDWKAGTARGQHENMPVDLPLKPGLQDRMSVQVWIMQKLASGQEPGRVEFVDRDEIKDYVYTNEGKAMLKTALGPLDTVIYSSTREGSTRVSRFWYAPSLGYLPVRAEQARRGKVETVLSILKIEKP